MPYKNKDHPIKGRWQIDEYEFNRCPHESIDKDIFIWIRAFNLFKAGILPNTGGWLNQPNKYIEIMNFIENVIRTHESGKSTNN